MTFNTCLEAKMTAKRIVEVSPASVELAAKILADLAVDAAKEAIEPKTLSADQLQHLTTRANALAAKMAADLVINLAGDLFAEDNSVPRPAKRKKQ